MTQTLAQELAALAAGTSYDGLPSDVRESVRDRTIDSLGVCLAATELDTSRQAQRMVLEKGGVTEAHVVGRRRQVPATGAAFANGVLAHSLDFDDTHLPSILHPSSSVIPAALAVAEKVGAAGPAFVSAVAVGLEVCVRIGEAGYDHERNSNLWFDRGQHATSICGTIGAAVAAGMLLGLGEKALCDVIGVASSMASGIIEANRGGGTVKRLHCGWAAQAGISAAELVILGFTGPPTVLEGRFGLFRAFLGDGADESAISRDLGTRWRVPEIFFKPYPANHFTHAIVDAAAVLARRGVKPADVEWAEISVPEPIVRTVGEPIESKRAPRNAYEAQFSGPYAVAVGLFGGHGLGAALEDYTDELAVDPERRDLMSRVSVGSAERLDRIYPMQFPAILRVGLVDGSVQTVEVLENLGSPQRPLGLDELATKFRANAGRCLGDEAVAVLLEGISSIEQIGDICELMALTVIED
jgi:2-methylcitrate dehydratase PrpD